MRQCVARQCALEHEFVCVTDRPRSEFSDQVRVVPLWEDHDKLPPAFPNGPSCYRRLRLFSLEAHELLGVAQCSTVVSIDLDSVPCGPLAPLWGRDERFIGWRASPRAPTCGSMFLLKLGSLSHVWEQFDHAIALAEAQRTGFVGTDQAWMARWLADTHPGWGTDDGVYSFKMHCLGGLPEGARVVFFHGKPDPWDVGVRKGHKWIRDHYPLKVEPPPPPPLPPGWIDPYTLTLQQKVDRKLAQQAGSA